MTNTVSPITLLVTGLLYLVENIILLYVFLTPRRSRAFQVIAFVLAAVAVFLSYFLGRNFGVRPFMRYYFGSLYLVPCVLIFKETIRAKVFVFFMNYSITQFIYLLSLYLDRMISPPLPNLCVMLGLLVELAALPLASRYLRKPVRSIIGIIDSQRPSFTLFPILSFALLAYYGVHEFEALSIIPISLSIFLIVFTYYLISASITTARRQIELERLSDTDPLTGIHNRRYMERRIAEELGRCRRTGQAFAMAMIDIDFFKRVNDEHGHDCGDFILKEIVAEIAAAVRSNDILARWGGEEFLLLLPATDGAHALVLAERIRMRIADRRWRYDSKSMSVTVTLGLSVATGDDDAETLVKRADIALYDGKNSGRNCSVLFGKEGPATHGADQTPAG